MLLQSCMSSEEPWIAAAHGAVRHNGPLQVAELVFKLSGVQLTGGNHPGLGAQEAPGHLGYLSFWQGDFPALSEAPWGRHLRATGKVLS